MKPYLDVQIASNMSVNVTIIHWIAFLTSLVIFWNIHNSTFLSVILSYMSSRSKIPSSVVLSRLCIYMEFFNSNTPVSVFSSLSPHHSSLSNYVLVSYVILGACLCFLLYFMVSSWNISLKLPSRNFIMWFLFSEVHFIFFKELAKEIEFHL